MNDGKRGVVLIRSAFFALAYYGAAELGQFLTPHHENQTFTMFWPPSGLFLGVVALCPLPHIPIYCASAACSNLIFDVILHGHGLAITCGFILANTMQALIGAWLLRTLVSAPLSLSRLEGILGLVTFGAVISTAVGATIGSLVLVATAPEIVFRSVWITWWISNVLGILVVTPILWTWPGNGHLPSENRSFAKSVEFLAMLLSLIAITAFAFQLWGAWPLARPYLAIPFLLWAALRFDTFRTSLTFSTLACTAIYCTSQGVDTSASTIASGHSLVVSVQIFLSVSGLCTFTVAAIMTERAEALRSLEENREWLSQAIRASDMAVWSWDTTANYVSFSDEFPPFFGFRAPDTLRTKEAFLFTVHPEDRTFVEDAIRRSLEDHEPLEVDFRVVWPNGSIHWLASRGKAYRDYSGKPTRVAGILVNIDRQKIADQRLRESEEQLRQAQKMEAVGQLAGGIAHDFNNLLTVINGYSELLLGELDDDDPNASMVNDIRNAGERAATLTKQLLAFSRKQILRPTTTDFNQIVQGLEGILRPLIGEDVSLVTRLSQGIHPIHADVGQLEQVLVNLVVNARDAMPRGGFLTIETANVYLSESDVTERPELIVGHYSLLSVMDTGIGMEEAVLARIFEPFFTTKAIGKGTGLGLAMVYGFVKQSSGHVEVTSRPMRGTAFRIFLPRMGSNATVLGETRKRQTLTTGNERLLVVEDNSEVRSITELSLSRCGYTVLVAGKPEQALEIVANTTLPIDLLLTDVVMPQMNGRELAKQILETRPHLKVLYMSGYTQDVILAAEKAEDHFLQKPFTPEILAQKVRSVLDS